MYKLAESLDWGEEQTIGYFTDEDDALGAAQSYLREKYPEYWPVDADLSMFGILKKWFGRTEEGRTKRLTIYLPHPVPLFSYDHVR